MLARTSTDAASRVVGGFRAVAAASSAANRAHASRRSALSLRRQRSARSTCARSRKSLAAKPPSTAAAWTSSSSARDFRPGSGGGIGVARSCRATASRSDSPPLPVMRTTGHRRRAASLISRCVPQPPPTASITTPERPAIRSATRTNVGPSEPHASPVVRSNLWWRSGRVESRSPGAAPYPISFPWGATPTSSAPGACSAIASPRAAMTPESVPPDTTTTPSSRHTGATTVSKRSFSASWTSSERGAPAQPTTTSTGRPTGIASSSRTDVKDRLPSW
ncbi:hypothetical protein SAMN06272739_2329 [Blastococcus haudaquaticus]|uniref:Uncharacterized protein n=1 Tax=Blastococcus haudaquaticus TaxID=1938745 RepID=A0A286GWJ7_9ACTN|nr:hypothetical protein SAMN06272739_2329 [Blastococcus haudaquaticus]